MKFSERYGYMKPREAIQIDSMDEQLRTALWNLLIIYVLKRHCSMEYWGDPLHFRFFELTNRLWLDFYEKALDTMPQSWAKVVAYIRSEFYSCDWYVVYDLVEFVVDEYNFESGKEQFVNELNRILEKYVSAYRFVSSKVVQITEGQEVDEIEEVISDAKGAERTHIQRALELLSDRENPDYRNSVKESISAVESLIQRILGDEKGTLGQMLKRLEEKVGLHAALRSAFNNLYGYASDEGGIRHALIDSETVKFEDAKFFLVACSAFINLVKGKLGEE
ncbi:AbiJ-NTD4 domain-containing protein [Pseudomonas citronellolis]|uniref:AbiJ-NTD4 domain-containing protein n=1 Tax=Pseudomonas citronellolis TaxID=53408 RepID=UPI0022BA5AC0|nr:hypothetical protein [Pseudomonas citronellolis]WBG62202.1 hypothetical protein ELR50_04605 [Pseudomonas citronellolis]